LLILPLFHVNAIVISVTMPLLAGGSVFIADRFDPKTFFDLVERERPTYFSAVPTIYNMLEALPADVRPDTSSLRYGACGAAPASAELPIRFEARYGFPIIEGYGLSEGTCFSTVNPVAGPRRAGTVGVAVPGQELRIVDEQGDELATGMDGEVIVRGPNVMRGYLGRPEDTAKTIVDGWLYTGDLGSFDDDGYLTLRDRSKDLIISGGMNIYPREVEEALLNHAGVRAVAVIGGPHPEWGESVVAFVVPADDAAPPRVDELDRTCLDRIARYKRPRDYRFIDALPTNNNGKVVKRELHDLL